VNIRLPHPVVLLLGCVALAAVATWTLAAGEYDRAKNAATGREVVVAGTFHAVPAAPVGPFDAVRAVPEGFIEAADVIAVVLFVGGAWVVIDRIGTLGRLVGWMVGRFRSRGLIAIPVLSLFFGTMGAVENMQEEIIPLVPVLLLLGRGLGIDAVSVVAMSAGSAMIGSAFGPTNPFQAGIAMKLADIPALAGGGVRLAMFAVGLSIWIAWTWRHAARTRSATPELDGAVAPGASATGRDLLIFVLAISPIAAYVYGALQLDWGFNELSGAFLVAGIVAGLIGGLRVSGTVAAYFEGMQSVLPAAVLVGVARSISIVLTQGHVIDTIVHGLADPLSRTSPALTGLLMIPVQAAIHVIVPSVSGQAVLTMPIMAPLADLVGLSRQVAVVAYQTGAGLTELLTPTNGALMAILLAAGVSFQKWVRFAVPIVAVMVLIGLAGMLLLR
jgi:uncharacterized ion transporter superfamily protein YfcC